MMLWPLMKRPHRRRGAPWRDISLGRSTSLRQAAVAHAVLRVHGLPVQQHPCQLLGNRFVSTPRGSTLRLGPQRTIAQRLLQAANRPLKVWANHNNPRQVHYRHANHCSAALHNPALESVKIWLTLTHGCRNRRHDRHAGGAWLRTLHAGRPARAARAWSGVRCPARAERAAAAGTPGAAASNPRRAGAPRSRGRAGGPNRRSG